ncbi:MAG: O-antigen ligase family protein [Clostridia bacterium]|nr:O-antigen ligase family protein [Clostridia bacterium]
MYYSLKQSAKPKYKLIPFLFAFYTAFSFFDFFFIGSMGSISKFFAIFLIGLVFLSKINKKMHIENHTIFSVLWMLWAAISLLWASGTSNGIDILMGYGMNVLLLFAMYNADWNKDSYDLYKNVFYAAGILLVFIALFGSTTYRETTTRSTISLLGRNMDPNKLVYLMLPSLAFTLEHFTTGKLFKRVCAIGFSLIWFYVAFSTGSRSGLIAAIAVVCVYFFFESRGKKQKSYLLTFFVFAVVILLFYDKIISSFGSEISNRLNVSSFSEGDTRLVIWENALKTFYRENPFLGLGVGSYRLMYGQEVHNLFVQTLTETGLQGLILFLTPIVCMFKDAYKRKDSLSMAMLFGIVIAVFFLNGYSEKFLWNILIFSVLSRYNKKSA